MENVQININGMEAELSNGLIKIKFDKTASVSSLVKDGVELVGNLQGVERDTNKHRTFYVDYHCGKFKDLEAHELRVIKNTPEMAHIAYIDNGTNNPLYLEYHIVMKKGESGLYSYVIAKNLKEQVAINEMRTIYRLDRDKFDYAYMSERTGEQPRYSLLETLTFIQDETWLMNDGEIYQKYDYAGYYSNNPVWGHYGNGFGFWHIPVSTEYFQGGPLKQELLVHQDAIALNYMQGGHFGAGPLIAYTGWQKLYGPWFNYINAGDNQQVIEDAKKKALNEQNKWPYNWVEEDLYPVSRSKVTGKLSVADGRSAAGAMVVLAKAGGEFYPQSQDYIFYANADEEGSFSLANVRAGSYTLYAYATSGTITNQLQVDNIVVEGENVSLGTVIWTPPNYSKLLWQVGKADRMAGEFKYGNELRNLKWISMVPENLTYTIGSSKEAEDWYFAQGKVGNWDIKFEAEEKFSGNAYLTVAIAGVAVNPKVEVKINDNIIATLSYGNDQSTYRSALKNARYRLEELVFPAEMLKVGTNTVTFNMTEVGTFGDTGMGGSGGIMYDTILLQIN
jgi:rhamnogalacturonan endolyase